MFMYRSSDDCFADFDDASNRDRVIRTETYEHARWNGGYGGDNPWETSG